MTSGAIDSLQPQSGVALALRWTFLKGVLMSDVQNPKIRLDWSRLLVFDQAPSTAVDAEAASRLTDPRLAKVGGKPKVGIRIRG